MNDLWPALGWSLAYASLATLLVGLIGIPTAYLLARTRFIGKSLLEALLTLPLVLPPTVIGYFLIVAFGHRGWIGRWLGISITFRWYGAVLAAAVVAFPLLVLPTRAAFASIDPEMQDMARLMGAGRVRTFWRIALPLARRGIAAGLLLALARSLGEFGATVMVLGDFSPNRTLPISIYDASTTGGIDSLEARLAVALLTGLSLVIVLIHNRAPAGRDG
jgi:molybdate transport system permease protein